MTKPFAQLEKETEESFEKLGRWQSKLFKRRIWELCQILRKSFPQINKLNYCNGYFWFGDMSRTKMVQSFANGKKENYTQIDYEKVTCIDLDGKPYQEGVNNLLNLDEDELSQIVGWKDKYTKIIKELNDIFNYISYENRYMECYCLDFTKKFTEND